MGPYARLLLELILKVCSICLSYLLEAAVHTIKSVYMYVCMNDLSGV